MSRENITQIDIDSFIDQFGLPFSHFSNPIKWDDSLGFSTTESYDDGYESLYKFGIYDKDSTNNLKEILISVSYGQKTDHGIKLGTGKNGLWNPLDLDFRDEFFYHPTKKIFFHYNKEILAKDILLYVEALHKKPTKATKGFILRSQLWFWRIFIPILIKVFDGLLISLLWLISGETLQKDIWKRIFSQHFSEKNNQQIPNSDSAFKNHQTMEFFGYKAKRWSVVFYCILQLIAYTGYVYSHLEIHFLHNIIVNNFLAICYIVVTFAIIESLIPRFLKSTILKFNQRLFNTVAFRKIKVS